MARSARMPKTLLKLQARHPAMIDDLYVERDGFDGFDNPYSYWLHLKPGWINTACEVHMIHEPSVREVMEMWKRVERCTCDDCTASKQKGAV